MADYGRVAALDIAILNETTARGRVAALDLAIVNETTARGRVAALDLAIVNETTARGRVAAMSMAVIWFNTSGFPIVQGNVGQGFVTQSGDAVGQGASFATQGTRAQGS